MLISSYLAAPEPGWHYAERFCNDGSPSGMSFAEHQVSDAYRPRSPALSFLVRRYRVPWNRAEVFAASPDPVLAATVLGPDGPLLLEHPDLHLGLPGDAEGGMAVYPTASSRTVVLADRPAVHAKLHYAGLLGRVPRELDERRTRASVLMSAELDTLLPAEAGGAGGYLAESLGVVTRTADGSREVGIVYREALPRPFQPGATALIPAFALFSKDLRSPGDPFLLQQLLDSDSRGPTEAFFGLLELILRSFTDLVWGLGLVPEDHAQNLLFELGPDCSVRRVVRRDLLDWYGDLAVIAVKARSRGDRLVRTLDLDGDAERCYGGRSYAFDFRLGDYILDPLIALAVRLGVTDEAVAVDWVKARVHQLAAAHDIDIRAYFSPWSQVYYYRRTTQIWAAGRPNFATRPGPRYR